MGKIKMIRNIKNSIENVLFVCVLLTIGSVLATLLYLAFDIFSVALFTAKMWAILLLSDVLLFTASQFCDILIWRVKTKKNNKKNGNISRMEKISPVMWVKGFCKAVAYYCF